MEWCHLAPARGRLSTASAWRLPVPRPTRSPRRPLVALLLAVPLALTACGGSSADDTDDAAGSGSGSASAEWPVSVTGAIGADDQVEAVDSTSNYPEGVPTTDLSAFTPNAEAIAGYDPDLVVLSDDLNGIVDSLEALKVPTLLLGAAQDLDDSYAQLETLGDATGHADEAADVIADMQDRIKAAVASVPDDVEGMRVYHELDPTLYSAASSTFIGGIYSMFGLENIADGSPDAAGGYPQLSAEYVVGQAPELIVLADTDCCDQSAETLAQRPAFDTVPAVQAGRVLAANDDVASRWGPRVADFTEQLADVLKG